MSSNYGNRNTKPCSRIIIRIKTNASASHVQGSDSFDGGIPSRHSLPVESWYLFKYAGYPNIVYCSLASLAAYEIAEVSDCAE